MSKSTAGLTIIPHDWREVMQRRKALLDWPDWSEAKVLRAGQAGKTVRTPRDDVHTVAAETTQSIFQLGSAQGVGLEGVRLRFRAWAYRRHQDVTATLEVVGGRNFVTISRIDAWPSDPHHNSLKTLRKPGLKGFQPEIAGCHVHRFNDNVRYGAEAFGPGPEGNLPVAIPFSKNLESFRDFLRCVRDEFNIEGLDEFPAPPSWQELV